MRFGIDHSSAPPNPALLKAKGVTFVCRYLSTPGNPKNVTLAEAFGLRAQSIDLVLVFETMADRALGGYANGVMDAKAAQEQATGVQWPDAPIYFVVDFDESDAQRAQVDAYFDGVASVIGWPRTGGYGGVRAISELFDRKKIRYGWQTYAWSGSPTDWDPRAHIHQTRNGVEFCGIQVDYDTAVKADFGQCRAPLRRKVSNTVRRHRLRLWVLAERARGVSWAVLKRTAKWKLWRRLGGH
jgi:hypothetical protein